MTGRQAERSEATRGQLVAVARELFAGQGYERTPLDQITRRAGVTKGALYHHFENKRELFAAVLEQLEQEVVERVVSAAARYPDDLWSGLQAGVRAFLESAANDLAIRNILLIEGPSVLGWERWKEIDDRYGFALIRSSLEHAVEAGIVERRPIDPLARLFLAALSEAALQVARAPDRARAMEEMADAVWSILESMRADSSS